MARTFAGLMTVFVLFALAGYQVSSEVSAVRLLSRLGAAVVEIDRWLPAHKDDVQLRAREATGNIVIVQNLPVRGVVLPSAAAAQADEPQLRSMLASAMGRRLYVQGSDAFRADDASGRLSSAEPVRWLLALLSEDAHTFWKFALMGSTVLLLAVVAAMLVSREPPLPALIMGSAVAAGWSLVAWWLAFAGTAILEGAIDKETMQIARDCAWLSLRDSFAVLVGVAALQYLVNLSSNSQHSRPAEREVDGQSDYRRA